SEIDLRSISGFIHSAKLFEPAKKRSPGSVRKRPFQPRFPRARRLPNDHYIAHDRASWDRSGLRAWAATAFQQARNVTSQFNLFGLVHGRISHEGHKGTPRTSSRFSPRPLQTVVAVV